MIIQEKSLSTFRDVDLATNKLAESEMQLRTVYRVEYIVDRFYESIEGFLYQQERERFETERDELQQHVAEQTELFEMEQQEHDRLLREQYVKTSENLLITVLLQTRIN